MRQSMKYAAAGAVMFMAAGQAAAADMVEEAAPGCDCYGGPYISLFAGATFDAQDPHGSYSGSTTYELDTDTGFIVGGAFGAHITPNFRGEVELSFKSHDIDDVKDSDGDTLTGNGDVDIFFILANFWYDFDMGPFTPYLGGGVGVAKVDSDFSLYDHSYFWDVDRWTLAGQVGAGVQWKFADHFGLDLGYRLKATAPVTFEAITTNDITGVSFVEHVVQLGLTFDF